MRTDLNRISKVTKEMRLNDKLYNDMKKELDDFIIEYYFNDYDFDDEDLIYDFETLYFMRRILSVIEKHDLPFNAVVGLSIMKNRLKIINEFRDMFLPDEDSDTEMYEFILELGYRFYDITHGLGISDDELYDILIDDPEPEDEEYDDDE